MIKLKTSSYSLKRGDNDNGWNSGMGGFSKYNSTSLNPTYFFYVFKLEYSSSIHFDTKLYKKTAKALYSLQLSYNFFSWQMHAKILKKGCLKSVWHILIQIKVRLPRQEACNPFLPLPACLKQYNPWTGTGDKK